jgi:hypothetical protein
MVAVLLDVLFALVGASANLLSIAIDNNPARANKEHDKPPTDAADEPLLHSKSY